MSLRVWLPLNGNSNDQGLSPLQSPTVNTMTYESGKIGAKCGVGSLAWHLTEDCLDNTWSIAMWVKPDSLGPYNNILFCKNIKTSSDCQIYFSIISNTQLNLGVNGPSTSISKTGLTFTLGTWYHVVATYDGTTAILYLNGEEVKRGNVTTAKPIDRLNINLNGRSNNDNNTNATGGASFSFNDFRIYDHALSGKEVREIAKGLILHYKLDSGLFGNSNLLLNTHFDKRYNQTTGWNTTKNGTLLASNWGGYNPGVANQATCYHAHLKLFNNEYVYEYIKDTETWLGISQGGLQSKLIAGKTYTFSCEQYSVTNTNYMSGGLYYYKTNATSASFHLGYINCNTNRQQNTWQKFTYTFTAPSDGDYNKNMQWYCYGNSGGAGTFYLRHLKLEEGNTATPWCLADSELGIDRMSVEDSSGYNHNGTIVGDLIPITDTKRYTVATKWNSSAPTTNNNTGLCYIQTPLTLTTPSQMTITWWGNPESGYGGNTGHAAFCTSNNETAPTDYNSTAFHHRDSGFDIYPSDGSGGKRLGFSYIKNEWHHYAVTYDGTTAYTYQDGELKSSREVGANKTLASFSQLYIGFSRAGGVWRKTLGSYSDFRIYCTALSNDDIKELYQTSASIDDKQNFYGREFSDTLFDTTSITKAGIVSADDFIEDTLALIKEDKSIESNCFYEY